MLKTFKKGNPLFDYLKELDAKHAVEDAMVARRVKRGGNRKESVELLKQLQLAHSGNNLDFALQYNGFTA